MTTADDLDAAISCVFETLDAATERDWSTAGTGTWTAWQTANHIGDCLLSYAGQLVARPTTRYVRFEATADAGADPSEVLEFAVAGAKILAATIHTTPPEVRAYHPTGLADAAHFAGMGCVEMLIHGHDIAEGFGLALDPPREMCARVLDRMFGRSEADPWTGLLWATNRIELPGRESQAGWRWQGPPSKG